jgi:hypothetical protein
VLSAIALVCIAALGSGSWWWFQEHQKSIVKDRVLTRLHDPDSAKFRNVKYFRKTDGGCGEVNAKNMMGGYVGFTGFVALPNGDVLLAPEDYSQKTDTQQKIDLLKKQIDWMKVAEENCPPEKKS